MKNLEELYEKYYDAYKNNYDTDDELHEAKKKKFDYKQFEFVDKTDKQSKLDEETKKKKFLKRLKIKKKVLIKRDLWNILTTNLLH